MKTRFFFLLILSSAVSPWTSAQESTEPRSELFQAGEDLLDRRIQTEEFVARLDRLRQDRPLSADEAMYIQDVDKKQPSTARRICSGQFVNLCQTPSAEELIRSAPTTRESKLPLENPPPDESTWWNRNGIWIVGLAVGGLATSALLKDRELVIRGY